MEIIVVDMSYFGDFDKSYEIRQNLNLQPYSSTDENYIKLAFRKWKKISLDDVNNTTELVEYNFYEKLMEGSERYKIGELSLAVMLEMRFLKHSKIFKELDTFNSKLLKFYELFSDVPSVSYLTEYISLTINLSIFSKNELVDVLNFFQDPIFDIPSKIYDFVLTHTYVKQSSQPELLELSIIKTFTENSQYFEAQEFAINSFAKLDYRYKLSSNILYETAKMLFQDPSAQNECYNILEAIPRYNKYFISAGKMKLLLDRANDTSEDNNKANVRIVANCLDNSLLNNDDAFVPTFKLALYSLVGMPNNIKNEKAFSATQSTCPYISNNFATQFLVELAYENARLHQKLEQMDATNSNKMKIS